MSKAPSSVVSILAIIALLGLTVIATVLYSGDPAQRAKIEHNFFWHKTKVIFDGALGLLSDTSKISTKVSTEQPDNSSKDSQISHIPTKKELEPSDSIGFMSNTVSKIKKAWEESDKAVAEDSNSEKFLQWKTLANGAEIIFRSEKGIEYKLLLPFKFLSH